MLTKTEKAEHIQKMEERLARQRISIFTDFRGISVSKLSRFRRELKTLGAEFKVMKKTLMARALSNYSIQINTKELEGEIGVIFGYEDQVAPAKLALKFSKENDTFKVLKGILEGKVLEGKEVIALARLPSREELLAQVARVLAAPMQAFARVLNAPLQNLVVALNQIREQKS